MTTIFGQLRNGVISNNQQRTLNRMRRARNNPGHGTPRAQMFRFTRNLNAPRNAPRNTRKRTRSRSGSRSGTHKKRKSSH